MEAKQDRPKYADIPAKTIAEKLADDVLSWLRGESTREQVVADLEKAIAYGHDGYDIAKYLDQFCSWGVDSQLVEILDNAFSVRSQLHDNAVQEWVLACSIKPALPVGAKVKVKNRAAKSNVVDGEVVSINEKRGTYTVFIEALGHVRKGMGTTGIILTFEEVEMQTAESAEVSVS